MHDNPLLPLQIAELNYQPGSVKLLDGIDLSISNDLITMVMGPNGAGKSLLLRLMHGLLRADHGTITWNGQAPDVVRTSQAMVFQRPILLRRSVAANIDFALKQVQISDRSQRDAILSSAGLLAKAAQPARLLSGGEQQRLALARALATNPRVLFLDEPTASLDPVSVHLIEQRVRLANQDGTKIIFVTHDIGQARRLAGDVVFINQGRVLEHTQAAAFFDQPVSPAARAYLDGRLLLPETQVAIKTNHDKN